MLTVRHCLSESAARLGRFEISRGGFDTPCFMPVGTQGSVKSLASEDLEAIGYEIILSNTYHLYLRPGGDVLGRFDGLHRFMGWQRPILTDSGGYQVFSLSELRKIRQEGVEFRSHLDGSKHLFTPESVIEFQHLLGSDIAMVLDVCPPFPAGRDEVAEAVRLTTDWARRSIVRARELGVRAFAIVQGGVHPDLRRQSAEQLVELGFDGYAIGGLGIGESKEQMWEAVESVMPLLPADKPRYLMGIGRPEDFAEGISRGIDMFDCVVPTRNARNGTLYTSQGRINIRREQFRTDDRPIDEDCGCPACRRYSRAYIRHLFMAGEILALRLNTLHNLTYYFSLIKTVRTAILSGKLDALRRSISQRYDE